MSAATTVTTTELAPTERIALATTGLEPSTAASLRALFMPFLDRAQEWESRAKAIVVTSVDQKREMKFARESRLALREIRVEVEHARKASKADALSRSKAIDGLANAIKGVIEPIEAYLLEQESFADRAEEARKSALQSARADALRAYGADPSVYANLGESTEEQWDATLEGARLAHEARIEAARQEAAIRAEAERIAAEKREAERQARVKAEAERVERERLAAEENARLKREAADREAAAAAERARIEAEREAERAMAQAEAEAREAAVQAERAAAEAELRKAREETDRAARELASAQAAAAQVKAEAERATAERAAADAALAAAEAAARQAAELAPDREKLEAFAAMLQAIEVPTLTTPRGKAAAAKVSSQLAKMAAWVTATAEAM